MSTGARHRRHILFAPEHDVAIDELAKHLLDEGHEPIPQGEDARAVRWAVLFAAKALREQKLAAAASK